MSLLYLLSNFHVVKGKGKAIPQQAWCGLDGSRKLSFPDFMTTAQNCHPYAPAAFTPQEIHLVLISVRG